MYISKTQMQDRARELQTQANIRGQMINNTLTVLLHSVLLIIHTVNHYIFAKYSKAHLQASIQTATFTHLLINSFSSAVFSD